MADIKISEILTKEQILLLNSESFLKELKTHEIIFIEGGGGYSDYGYGNGYRDYGYGNGYRDYGYGNGYRDYGYGNYGEDTFYDGGRYYRRV